jgi:hypothetical protein
MSDFEELEFVSEPSALQEVLYGWEGALFNLN